MVDDGGRLSGAEVSWIPEGFPPALECLPPGGVIEWELEVVARYCDVERGGWVKSNEGLVPCFSSLPPPELNIGSSCDWESCRRLLPGGGPLIPGGRELLPASINTRTHTHTQTLSY